MWIQHDRLNLVMRLKILLPGVISLWFICFDT